MDGCTSNTPVSVSYMSCTTGTHRYRVVCTVVQTVPVIRNTRVQCTCMCTYYVHTWVHSYLCTCHVYMCAHSYLDVCVVTGTCVCTGIRAPVMYR